MTTDSRVFRTQAWVQAWLDTWGNDSRIKLIDLGGSAKPQDFVYIAKTKVKKIIPVQALCLAGVGCGVLSTPRAEYNDLSGLIQSAGGVNELAKEIKRLDWNQFYLPDLLSGTTHEQNIIELGHLLSSRLHVAKVELAYSVGIPSFSDYLSQLGANTRLAYFNRREKLNKIGAVEFELFPIDRALEFFKVLNQFHLQRWGVACYSDASQAFLKNFMGRLVHESGSVILEAMRVNGEIVSVLFDVVYCGRRYNFQSGYFESKFPKIALGAIHMGYAIEAAIQSHHIYDFMAGEGKNSNYKARIATAHEEMRSLSVERGVIGALRYLQKSII